MKKQEIARLMPREAHKRIKTAQSIVVIGPTSSGKSTLIYALVNHQIIKFILVGIGVKCQTTIIPCNFLFDERIEKGEFFSIQIRTKVFSPKQIHIKVVEILAKQFALCGYEAEETISSIDSEVMLGILEPADAEYHLGKIVNEISIEDFKNIVNKALTIIEDAEESFYNRVKKKKKEPDKRKVSIDEIRCIIMEDMWNELPEPIREEYQNWLNSIGEKITQRLNICLGANSGVESINEFSVVENDILPYGGMILQSLFDPYEPYSLIVEEMTMACRPRDELIDMFYDKIPLRFCLRDTMGLNQINMDNNSVKDALDIALNCSPDSILLLMNLEERDDVIENCCEAINSKIGKAQRLDVPVHVIFTKADRVLSNIINKADRKTVELTQADYTEHIEAAIDIMENSIEGYLSHLMESSATWLSIRYLEEKIDPIQCALKEVTSPLIEKFTRNGLYRKIDEILKETQMRILPKGVTSPLYVTVKDTGLPAVEIKIDPIVLSKEFNQIQEVLTKDKAVVNGYQITDTRRIHGRSVVRYYENLQIGLGYTTNAYVYGNFSINMKGMLKKVLENKIPDFLTLYQSEVIKTLADNMDDVELDKVIAELDENEQITQFAFADINPAIFDDLPLKVKKIQKLHLIFRHYFGSSDKFYMVIDRVAFNLSYGNDEIKKMTDAIYNKPFITYDETIRLMQENFKKQYGSPNFADVLAAEMSSAMTELVNKMFVII